MPEPRPAETTRGDWDDWYTIAPPPPPQPYPPHPPQGPPPGAVVPLQRQPIQRQPFQPPPGGGPPGEPFRPYQPGPPAGPPRGGRRSESNAGLWTILLLLLAGAGAGVVLLVAHPFGNHNQRQTASTGSPAASGTAPAGRNSHASGSAKASPASTASGSGTSSAVAASAAEQRAASNVASMLSQSASDRTAIIGAATDIGNCGPSLNADPKVFDDAAASRRTMLASLTTMPGRSTLPPALIGDLTQAWQASITADQAYAQWANDEIAQGCVRNDTSDPGYQATVAPDRQATQYKDSFVVLWNPIASGYGLTQYSADQF